MTKTVQQIPGGWREIRLPEIAGIRKGLTYRSADYSDEKNGLVFVTLKCISKGGGFNKDGIKFYKGKYDQSNIVKAGDLIIANTDLTRAGDIIGAPLFMPHLSDNSVLISMDLSAIDIDKDKVIKQYLYYYLLQDGIRQFMRGISSGSTVLHLQLKSLSSLDVLLPPIDEQIRIAAILSKVDEEIEKVSRIIEQTEKLKKGLMQKLLTKRIWHTKFKQTELGEIPEGWEVSNLERVSETVIDCKNRTPKYFDDGTYFVVRTPNVRSGKLILDNMLRTDQEHYYEWTKRGTPKSNDLLITREAPAGEFCLVPENLNICLGQRMMLARANYKIVTPQFLLYWFQSPIMQKYISNVSTGSTVAHLRVGQIKELRVVVPPLYEQKKIASILGRVDGKFEHHQSLKSHLMLLKKGLMNDLLSGKVRVN